MSLCLTQGLHRALQRQPGRIATVFEGRQRTYGQYVERVARLAGALRALGVKRGDRLGMLALNSDRYLEFFHAAWWAGAVVNPVNIRWNVKEVAFSLDDCDTRILFLDDGFTERGLELRDRSSALELLIYTGDGAAPSGMLNYEALLAEAEPMADSGAGGNDLAAVMYTGGTTGFPKGVMLSHENLASNALSFVAGGCTSADAIALLIAPMFHVACGVMMNAHMAIGSTFVIAPAFSPALALQAIESHRVTDVLLAPTMLQLATDFPGAGGHDLSSVKKLVYGGSVISEGILRRAMKLFAGAGFYQAYGMTELSPCVTFLDAQDHRSGRTGILCSAGRANLTSQIRIVDARGAEVPRGQVGEVIARGPGVMLGYWNRPELTAAAIRDGWMHTGDGGTMDEQGYLYIVDRMKDMIVSGGENVYSAEVENALSQHPAVALSAVVGIPSEQWGEAVHAVVVLNPAAGAGSDALARELIAHCRQLIAAYKCPRSIEFRATLPMTGAGKIRKSELREPYWRGRTRVVN